MTHDPYQTFAGYGQYPGQTAPFGSPYNPLQNLMNPTQGFQGAIPQTGITGYGGIHPQQLQQLQQLQQQQLQQLQLAAMAQQGGIPQFGGLSPQFGGLSPQIATQHPLLAAILQNPLVLAQLQNPQLSGGLQNPYNTGLQNPLLNPILAQSAYPGTTPYGWHQHSPYQQFGQQLPPQTLLGQNWLGQPGPYGGGAPFGRGFQSGMSPWACF